MHWWPSFQRRRIEICGRIVKSMLSHCPKMFTLGTYWTTWYSMVSDQTCTKNHKMDQGLWQTPESIDRSQNGPKRVTNDWVVWYLTSITHVNTHNIVMLETPQNYADWDCFKTLILQEILRIQHLHQVEHCASSEAIRLFQSVGCVRNKLQFRTVKQNQKSFPWMQDWGWMVFPHLFCGTDHRSSWKHESE